MPTAQLSYERCAKEYINAIIYLYSKGVVVTGPFKGMQLLEEVAWPDGNLGPKVLGCYEQELHNFLEEEITRLKKLEDVRVLDLGCSEGYYAVGMALRLPKAEVMAIDSCDDAVRITGEAARANGVLVLTGKECPYDYKPNFVICDVEGAEIEYLDPEKFPALLEATMLVECHDADGREITDVLAKRFQDTHLILVINEGSRDPNQFECLIRFDSLVRWLAISEGRPCRMHWMIMIPHFLERPSFLRTIP